MLGAAVGDFIGSVHEFAPTKDKAFQIILEDCVYTDDTILTVAVGEAIASNGGVSFASSMRRWGNNHVTSYGPTFWQWLVDPEMGPYGSWANGASMRVSSAAWLSRDVGECLALARLSAEPTHNHPEGIRGAQATALAIFAARSGWSQSATRNLIETVFGYDLSRSVDEVRSTAKFELKSWISVPEAITCAVEACDFEDAVRNAVSLGADADTQAAIAGAIAEAWFPIPDVWRDRTLQRMPEEASAALRRLAGVSKDIVFEPLTPEAAAAIERWSPESVGDWEREHNLVAASERAELEKWENFERDIHARPAAKQGAWHRLTSWIRTRRSPYLPKD